MAAVPVMVSGLVAAVPVLAVLCVFGRESFGLLVLALAAGLVAGTGVLIVCGARPRDGE